MDQIALVRPPLDGGWQLIGALDGRGFKADVAFWARLDGEDKWVLHLESPFVDEKGVGETYQLIHAILHDAPEWGVDPFNVVVFGKGNPMARAAAELMRPKATTGPFAVKNPKPYRGMTRYGGGSLGGFRVDEAYIYPPWEPALNTVT